MTTLTIRNLDVSTKEGLRVRAAMNGRSMEAEARRILQTAIEASPQREVDLAEAIRRRFASFGGVENLAAHPPVDAGEPPRFEP